jgi:hypothetical protein
VACQTSTSFFQIVQSILRLNNILFPRESCIPVCSACQVAKSHQLPYSTLVHQSTAPLQMIFSDVWGPAPQSVGGFKYYISFIDDFSKFCWVYMMHDCTQAPHIFCEFQLHVERLLDTKIKCVQSDWGGKYQKMHNTFFKSLGIDHRVSCPHTYKQNGSAERKHHHIVKTGLAILAHAHMPLKFWDEAFLTAAYLINRIPTRVIDNTCPLKRLFHKPPNYSMLRVFDCVCWPNVHPYQKQKLSFRSKQCVFIGYSALHKGYKCLDPNSGRVYISRDVIFDEHVFPFDKLSSPGPVTSSDLSPSNFMHKLHFNESSSNVQRDFVQLSPVFANPLDAENSANTSTAASSGLHSRLRSKLCRSRCYLPLTCPSLRLGNLHPPFLPRLHPTKAVHWYLLRVWMTPAMRHLRLLYLLLTLWRMILWSPHPPEWLLLVIFLLRLLFISTAPVFRTISGAPKFVPTVLSLILQSPCKLNQCLIQLLLLIHFGAKRGKKNSKLSFRTRHGISFHHVMASILFIANGSSN